MHYDPTRADLVLKTARREAVETIIERHMLHWGIESHGVCVLWNRNGSSVPEISSAGAAGSMRNVPFGHDGQPNREGMEAIAASCFLAIRAILRERSIRSAGHRPEEPPAWATSADPAVMSCLRHYGMDLANMPRSPQDLLQRIRNTGLTVDNADIQDGLIRVGALGDADGKWSISDYDRFRINVHIPVPETVLTALGTGRMTLEEIVLLPFAVPERLARRTRRGSDGGFAIQLDRRLSTWTPVPDGIDRSWLNVPLCQIQDIPF